MRKSIFKNSIFNMIYKMLNILFPMITAMYVARVLRPEGVGRVGYAQNILSYFTVVAALGISTYGAREIARVASEESKTNKLFSELFFINLLSTILCSAVYAGLIVVVPSFRSQCVLFFAVGIQLLLNVFNVDWFYSGKEEYVYITLRSATIKILSVICIFIFVKNENDLIIYALINALAVSANYLFNLFHLHNRVRVQFNNLQFKPHMKPILILLFTTLATDLYNQVDVTMMGSMCSAAEIGYYTYAIKLVRIVTSVSTAIAITTLPRMSQYYSEKKREDFNRLFNKTLEILFTIVVPCMLGIILVSDNAVRLVYGASFMPSAMILKLASPVILIVAISYQCGCVVLASVNKEKYLLLATIAGVMVNVTLNVILIPQYAGRGAALSSVCAELIVMCVHVYFVRNFIKIKIPGKDVLSLGCASAGMVAIVILMQKIFEGQYMLSLCTSIICGGGIYGIVLLLMKNSVAVFITEKVKGFDREGKNGKERRYG